VVVFLKEQQYRRAIESALTDPEPRGSWLPYLAENKFSQAEELLKQAKKDFPNNSAGYRMLGDFYYANNRLDQATTEYAALYRDHPKDLTVKKYYVQLLILKEQIDDAAKLNEEVLKVTPDDPDALICKGQIEIHRGKASAAINTLQSVLKNEPANAVAHYQLGLAFDQAGNLSQAEAEWRESIRLRPDLVDAHR
jgi:Flp pilus assembly protein TadD